MNKRDIRKEARELIKWAIGESFYEYDSFMAEDKLEAIYLGSVFSIYPSGKYYTPWANSNVEVCNRCKGKGCDFCGHLGSREAFEDELMNDYLEEYSSKYNCWIEAGEGDPCDIFLVRLVKDNSEEENND